MTRVPLVCPLHRRPLLVDQNALLCDHQHSYPVVRGVPILLRDDIPANHPAFGESMAENNGESRADSLPPGAIDSFVQSDIVHTNGNLYRGLRGKLTRYPIPRFPLAVGAGRSVLDLGCGWGRWSVAAEHAGFRAVGIDPSLRAVEAAQRVAEQLAVSPTFLVADARNLPFPDHSFDVVFSYSVFQHFSRADVHAAVREAERALRPGGTMLIQMANILGSRQIYNQIVDLVHGEKNIFRVRRWLPWHVLALFRETVGPTTLEPDGFFTLNPQTTDVDLLSPFPRFVVRLSSALCRLSKDVRPLRYLADSVFIEARKAA